MQKKKIIFFLIVTATLIWLVFMTYLSHQDGKHLWETSSKLTEWFGFLDVDSNKLNKDLRSVAHFIVFLVFAILFGAVVHMGRLSRWLMVFPFIWAVIDEATKPFMVGRHFAWPDLGRNEAGALVGYLIVYLIYRQRWKNRQKDGDEIGKAG